MTLEAKMDASDGDRASQNIAKVVMIMRKRGRLNMPYDVVRFE